METDLVDENIYKKDDYIFYDELEELISIIPDYYFINNSLDAIYYWNY